MLDVKQRRGGDAYEVWTHNGTRNTGKLLIDTALQLERCGAGEVVVDSIDRDGCM